MWRFIDQLLGRETKSEAVTLGEMGGWGAKGKASGCLPYRGNIMEKPALVGLEPLWRSLTNFALDSSQASGF